MLAFVPTRAALRPAHEALNGPVFAGPFRYPQNTGTGMDNEG